MIEIPEDDEALLNECKIDVFRSSGSGGQHVNVTNSAVRITHFKTGIVVTSQSQRSQYLNKIECLKKLRKKIDLLNYKKPIRKKTKPSKTTKSKNKEKKIKTSEKKELRKKPKLND
jgi:ribosome-associated protein